MRQASEVEIRTPSLGRRLTRSVAALGASVVMTMRIFGEPPQGRLRRTNFIEQVYEEAGVGIFDRREVVNERLVLTLPLPQDSRTRRGKALYNSN